MRRLTYYDEDKSAYFLCKENTPIEKIIDRLGEYEQRNYCLSLGEKIASERRYRRYNQKDFAERLGIKSNTLSQYEADKRRPGFETLESISFYLDIDFEDIVGAYRRTYFSDYDENDLGAIIKSERESMDITIEALAKEIKVPVRLVKKWEANMLVPNCLLLKLVAKACFSHKLNDKADEMLRRDFNYD